MANPYTLTFGKQPTQFIARTAQSQQVIDSFLEMPSSQQVYMITGVRGAGKTVFMTEIANEISQRKDWIVVELNPQTDLLHSLAATLSSENELARIFQSAEINLSLFGFGLEVKSAAPIADVEVALQKMLASLDKKGKRLLICIDEVTNTDQMRTFAAAFQIFIRRKLPVYLLMTGLYENIATLQDEKGLTFLYRAPKIYMGPLNISTIAADYKAILNLSEQESISFAKLTKGYSFAFQVFGYFYWEYPNDPQKRLRYIQQYLEEYSYEKIWSELSHKDREVLYALVSTGTGRVKDVREFLNLESNELSPYRQRLIRKGIISGDEYGYMRLLLPYFDQYILSIY